MKIRAVFFDAGETVIYRNPSLVSLALRHFEAAGIKISRKKLAKTINRAALEMKPVVEKGVMKDTEKWKIYVGKIFKYLKINDKKLADSLRHRLKNGTSFRAHRDAAGVVELLNRRGIVTGVISNAPAELEQILKKVKLFHRFSHIIISEKAGVEKPNKKIFLKALRLAGVKAKETVYVGDNYIADIKGALNAGITPVWIRRETKNAEFSFSGGASPKVRTIKGLKGLITIIRKEGWI